MTSLAKTLSQVQSCERPKKGPPYLVAESSALEYLTPPLGDNKEHSLSRIPEGVGILFSVLGWSGLGLLF